MTTITDVIESGIKQLEQRQFMAIQKYKFELKNDLSELKNLNRHLNDWGRDTGLQTNSILRINICLDELFTNIVSYGFDDDLEHIIKFTVNVDDDLLVINIEDDGIPFNPVKKLDPDFPANVESANIGGLGIHIIRKLIDNISYERKQGKNKLTMKKIIQESNKNQNSKKSTWKREIRQIDRNRPGAENFQ
jgi:anti-sigma regulatory factor (Ser/Thr protein kinase)